MVRILGRKGRGCVHTRAGRAGRGEGGRRSETKGKDGKCAAKESSSGRITFSPKARAAKKKKEGGGDERTPFEPWAQKLAHWSPGYCINAAGGRDGGEIIFAQKCNEASRSTGRRGARAVNNMNAKNHLLKVSQYDDGLKMDARSTKASSAAQFSSARRSRITRRRCLRHRSWIMEPTRSVSELLIRGAQIRLRPSPRHHKFLSKSVRKRSGEQREGGRGCGRRQWPRTRTKGVKSQNAQLNGNDCGH